MKSDDIDALIILYIAVTATDVDPIAEGIKKGILAARATAPLKKPIYIGWMVETDRERRFSFTSETIPTLPCRVGARVLWLCC